MTTAEIRDHLLLQDYIVNVGGKFAFTQKFYRDLEKDTRKEVSTSLTSTGRMLSDTELYKRFLIDAKIPRFGHTRDGGSYVTGAFTKTGAKELKSLLQKGYKYDVLCAAINKYYQTTDYYTKAEQVLKEGLWETYYDMVVEEGMDKQQVKEKKTLSLNNINKTIG